MSEVQKWATLAIALFFGVFALGDVLAFIFTNWPERGLMRKYRYLGGGFVSICKYGMRR